MNEIARVANPYGDAGDVVPRGGALAATDQSRAIAEVQSALVVARSNPRDRFRAMDRILNECQLQRLAEKAIYSYARGGTDIEGPSIHLARALARNWGNMSFGIREMERGQGFSTVQAFAWDQETNTREERVFTVPHSIGLKGGRTKVLTDERDIYELIANMGARRERACILGLIPDDVVDLAVDQCNATLRAKADTSPEAIQKLLTAFETEFGVTKAQLEARCQRRIDAIQPAQMVALRKIYRSLRDDMSKPEDWFEPIEADQSAAGDQGGETDKGNAAAKKALKERVKKDPPVDSAPAQQEGGSDAVTSGEQSAEPEGSAGKGAGSAAATDEAEEAAKTVSDIDGTDDQQQAGQPAYLATVRSVRERIDAAQTVKAIDAIDREWTNTQRVQVEEADETAARSIDQAIIARKRELKAQEG